MGYYEFEQNGLFITRGIGNFRDVHAPLKCSVQQDTTKTALNGVLFIATNWPKFINSQLRIYFYSSLFFLIAEVLDPKINWLEIAQTLNVR